MRIYNSPKELRKVEKAINGTEVSILMALECLHLPRPDIEMAKAALVLAVGDDWREQIKERRAQNGPEKT